MLRILIVQEHDLAYGKRQKSVETVNLFDLRQKAFRQTLHSDLVILLLQTRGTVILKDREGIFGRGSTMLLARDSMWRIAEALTEPYLSIND